MRFSRLAYIPTDVGAEDPERYILRCRVVAVVESSSQNDCPNVGEAVRGRVHAAARQQHVFDLHGVRQPPFPVVSWRPATKNRSSPRRSDE